jgi:trimethylamine--corrinoid protein Co-methyltransferase
MHASLLGFSLESLIIDNDMLGQCMRCVRGIEVNDDTLSKESIKRVCLGGAGHYLGDEQTLSLMQTEYVYPKIGDRNSPNVWAEQGASTMAERASAEKARILASHFPHHIADEIDRALRANHKICLPREAMGRAG